MEYTMDIRVRYSECAGDGTVPVHQILNYFQDCTTFHSEELQYGIQYNKEHHQAWFLLAYDIRILRKPRMFEKLSVVTEPYKMKGYYGYRRYRIRDTGGEDIISGDSIWILMDVDSLLPIRIPDEMTSAFIPDPSEEKIRIRRKIRPGKDWVPVNDFDISEIHLDTNHHVNNNFYAMWTENMIENDDVGRIRIDYRKAAVLGDHITVYRQNDKSSTLFRFDNQDQELLAYVSAAKDSDE